MIESGVGYKIVLNNFNAILNRDIKLYLNNIEIKIAGYNNTYEKICENCRYCPRILLFDIIIKDCVDKHMIKTFKLIDSDNKLCGIPYKMIVTGEYIRLQFIPIYLIKRFLEKICNNILSLPFDNTKEITKIGINKINIGIIMFLTLFTLES